MAYYIWKMQEKGGKDRISLTLQQKVKDTVTKESKIGGLCQLIKFAMVTREASINNEIVIENKEQKMWLQ